jgi:hypothetical protein
VTADFSLSAIAAQGGLLADGVAEDATKSTYARVMAKTLGGEPSMRPKSSPTALRFG